MNTQSMSLDVTKAASSMPYVYVGQGDVGGTTIEAHVYDDGVALDLTGMSARFEMRLPNGETYVRDTNCTVSGNTITYVVDEEHVAASYGRTDSAYFSIVDGSAIYSTNRFTVHVLRSAHDGAVPAESWDNAVDALVARGDAALEEYADAEQAREDAEEVRESKVITSATATVEQTTGTPSVSVELGSPSADGRSIAFGFAGIKGETGETGPQGETGATGPQGPSGVSDPLTTTEMDTVASDGTLTSTNAMTGTALTYWWTKLKAAFAAISHTHTQSQISDTPISVANGGTGATTAADARTALDAAQSNGATNTLYAAEQAIAQNASDISDLQDSVSTITRFSHGTAAGFVKSGHAWVFFAVSTDSAGYAVAIAQAITASTPAVVFVYNNASFTVASNNQGTVSISHNSYVSNVRMVAIQII